MNRSPRPASAPCAAGMASPRRPDHHRRARPARGRRALERRQRVVAAEGCIITCSRRRHRGAPHRVGQRGRQVLPRPNSADLRHGHDRRQRGELFLRLQRPPGVGYSFGIKHQNAEPSLRLLEEAAMCVRSHALMMAANAAADFRAFLRCPRDEERHARDREAQLDFPARLDATW